MARKILRIWEQTHRFSGEVLSVLYVYGDVKKIYNKRTDAFVAESPSHLDLEDKSTWGREIVDEGVKKSFMGILKNHLLLNESLEENLGVLGSYKKGDFLYSKKNNRVFIYSGEWKRLYYPLERIIIMILDSLVFDINSNKIVDELFPIEYTESDICLAGPTQCRLFKEALEEQRGLVWEDKRIKPKDKKILFKSGHWICEKNLKMKNPGLLVKDVLEDDENVSVVFGINSETGEIMTNVENWLPKDSVREPKFWERWYLNYKYWKYERTKKSKGN